MSEQAKILAEMQALIMNILKTNQATEAEADKIEELEVLLHQQKCFQKGDSDLLVGEEVANLFFANKLEDGVALLCKGDIIPEDFFGFVDYHYDEDHEDEEKTEMFTQAFMMELKTKYLENCK